MAPVTVYSILFEAEEALAEEWLARFLLNSCSVKTRSQRIWCSFYSFYLFCINSLQLGLGLSPLAFVLTTVLFLRVLSIILNRNRLLPDFRQVIFFGSWKTFWSDSLRFLTILLWFWRTRSILSMISGASSPVLFLSWDAGRLNWLFWFGCRSILSDTWRVIGSEPFVVSGTIYILGISIIISSLNYFW